MADRFSRFNEDRDFQVNTGVAEVRGRRWPNQNLLIPHSQFSFARGSAVASEPGPFSPASFEKVLAIFPRLRYNIG